MRAFGEKRWFARGEGEGKERRETVEEGKREKRGGETKVVQRNSKSYKTIEFNGWRSREKFTCCKSKTEK